MILKVNRVEAGKMWRDIVKVIRLRMMKMRTVIAQMKRDFCRLIK